MILTKPLKISCPADYSVTVTSPPAPEGVKPIEWDPQWCTFVLTFKGKELLRGTIANAQVPEMQTEVNRTISRHQQERRYNRSLHGIWNNYPVDWMWQFLQWAGFKYVAGGRSDTHLTHHFIRRVGRDYAFLVRFKGKVGGASFPRLYIGSYYLGMMQGLEAGRYE